MVSQLEHLGKPFRVVVSRIFRSDCAGVMEAVYILAQKCDFFDSLTLQYCNLSQNGLQVPTSLSSPNEGNDTVRTHVVAPSHNRKESSDR